MRHIDVIGVYGKWLKILLSPFLSRTLPSLARSLLLAFDRETVGKYLIVYVHNSDRKSVWLRQRKVLTLPSAAANETDENGRNCE